MYTYILVAHSDANGPKPWHHRTNERTTAASSVERIAFTVEEATDAIGIGRTKLYEEIKTGRLRAVKAGGRTLIPTEAIRAWLAAMPSANGHAAAL